MTAIIVQRTAETVDQWRGLFGFGVPDHPDSINYYGVGMTR